MAVKDTYVRARIDPQLKAESEEVLDQLGMTHSEAIRLFLSQVRLRRGLPFQVGLPSDNDDLLISVSSRQAAVDSLYDD